MMQSTIQYYKVYMLNRFCKKFKSCLLYNCRFNSVEYREAITVIDRVLGEHKRTLEFGEPQLDWCDLAVQVHSNTIS